MTKIALAAAEIYKNLRNLITEARRGGLEKSESYRKLVDALDEMALALHRMLYLDEKLDPESEEKIIEALKPPL